MYELEALPENYHTTAQLINHTRKHGVYIAIKIGIQKEELAKSLSYRENSSSVKENAFVMKDIMDHLRDRHLAISTLVYVHNINGMWLYSLAAIPQTGRKYHIIYDFSCSGLNEHVK